MLHNQTAQEIVVLVDDANNVLGTAPKATVHTDSTPLHRAFSCFCFRRDGKLLTQRRALHKITWPGIWANSVCGHPGLNESNECAVYRRMRHELGITTAAKMSCMAPDFRYRAELDGIVENELCPVFVAIIDQDATPNPQEVDACAWATWGEFVYLCRHVPGAYAPWTILEVEALLANPEFIRMLATLGVDAHSEVPPSA